MRQFMRAVAWCAALVLYVGVGRPAAAQDESPVTILGRGYNHDLAFSHDGQFIASADSAGIGIYSSADLTPVAYFGDGGAMEVKWSPDDQRIAVVAWDGQLQIWNVAGQILVSTIPSSYPSAFVWSSDSQRLAVAEWRHVSVWNSDGTPQAIFALRNSVNHALWFPDGNRLLVSTYEGRVQGNRIEFHVLDLTQPDRVHTLTSVESPGLHSLYWNADGTKFVAAFGSYTDPGLTHVEVRSAEDGALLHTIDPPLNVLTTLTCDAECAQVRMIGKGVSPDQAIWVQWDSGGALSEVAPGVVAVLHAAYSPDGTRLVTASGENPTSSTVFDTELRLWETAALDPIAARPLYYGDPGSMTFSQDGSELLIFYNAGIEDSLTVRGIVWNITTGAVVRTFNGPLGTEFPPYTGMSADLRFAAYLSPAQPDYSETRLHLHDTLTSTRTEHTIAGRLSSAVWSPDGTQIMLGGSDELVIWDVASAREIHRIPVGYLQDLMWVGGTVRWTDSGGERLEVWRSDAPAPIFTLPDGFSRINGQLLDDGRIVFAADRFWDVETGESLDPHVLRLPRSVWWDWSPSGQRAMRVSGDGFGLAIEVWSVETAEHLTTAPLYKYTEDPTLAWSRDESLLAYGGADGLIHVVRVGQAAG